jgi:hypothetical protein
MEEVEPVKKESPSGQGRKEIRTLFSGELELEADAKPENTGVDHPPSSQAMKKHQSANSPLKAEIS